MDHKGGGLEDEGEQQPGRWFGSSRRSERYPGLHKSLDPKAGDKFFVVADGYKVDEWGPWVLKSPEMYMEDNAEPGVQVTTGLPMEGMYYSILAWIFLPCPIMKIEPCILSTLGARHMQASKLHSNAIHTDFTAASSYPRAYRYFGTQSQWPRPPSR